MYVECMSNLVVLKRAYPEFTTTVKAVDKLDVNEFENVGLLLKYTDSWVHAHRDKA